MNSNIYKVTVIIGIMTVGYAMAGNLDSTSAPSNSGSAMYTLNDLYQRLNNGTSGSKRTGSFSQPSQGPTAGTMYTLNQIMAIMPEIDASGATCSDVVSGKTFWGLTAGQWGEQAGSMAVRSLSSGSTTVQAGYYNATDLATVDSDLCAGNIATNVTVFGIVGTANTNGGGSAYPAPVPRTGQTASYQTGDDGNLRAGVTWPSPRFTIQSDTNIALDNLTGLMWKRTTANSGGSFTWAQAISYCNSLTLGGYDDWRLPNRNELFSLADASAGTPSLPSGHPFGGGGIDSYLWSSTTSSILNNYAWYIMLQAGGVMGYKPKTYKYFVLPVRGGD